VSGPENLEVIKAIPDGAGVQAGVVDARNTKLEDPSALAETISGLAEALGPQRLRVSPSAGLEFLPREKARAKLEHLAAVAGKVNGREQ
jgi:methionine synthase II (cobalamin-independent)